MNITSSVPLLLLTVFSKCSAKRSYPLTVKDISNAPAFTRGQLMLRHIYKNIQCKFCECNTISIQLQEDRQVALTSARVTTVVMEEQ